MVKLAYVIGVIVLLVSGVYFLGSDKEDKIARIISGVIVLLSIIGMIYVHQTQLLPRGYSNSEDIIKLAKESTKIGDYYPLDNDLGRVEDSADNEINRVLINSKTNNYVFNINYKNTRIPCYVIVHKYNSVIETTNNRDSDIQMIPVKKQKISSILGFGKADKISEQLGSVEYDGYSDLDVGFKTMQEGLESDNTFNKTNARDVDIKGLSLTQGLLVLKKKNSISIDKKKYSKIVSSSTSSVSTKESKYSAENKKDVSKFSIDARRAINREFREWAYQRAEVGNMAAGGEFFSQATEPWDQEWFAYTPDGKMQVSSFDQVETNDFKIHCIGGVFFFTAKSGETGRVDFNDGLDGNNSSQMMLNVVDFDETMDKYLLGDNGVVYELKIDPKSKENVEPNVNYGVYVYGQTNSSQNDEFIVSQDQDAQKELKSLIAEHKND